MSETERHMHAEVITTGTELLLGETVDTNSAYIARCLRSIGLDLYYLITVGDNEHRMAEMLGQALSRSDVIIITGGLGPTVDDITRPAVARATGRQLVLMPTLLSDIESFFLRTGRPMTDNNRRQAYIPAEAIPIRNPVGTAPGFIVEEERGIVIALPGVPREMEHLMQTVVLPFLTQRLGASHIIKSRVLRTCSIGESTIDNIIGDLETMGNPTVGLSAHPGQTDIRITAKGRFEEEVDHLIAGVEQEIRQRMGDVIFGVDNETLEEVVAGLLADNNLTVAISESNTAGTIAGRLRDALASIRGSDRLRAALTTSPEEEDTEVRPEDVLEEAERLMERSGADLVLVVSGSHRPDQGVYGRETGRTLMAILGPNRHEIRPFRYGGSDPLTQKWIFFRALDLLRREMLGLPLDIT